MISLSRSVTRDLLVDLIKKPTFYHFKSFREVLDVSFVFDVSVDSTTALVHSECNVRHISLPYEPLKIEDSEMMRITR